MKSRNITESTVTLIREYIKSNIVSALNDVSTSRSDNIVSPIEPKQYFINDGVWAFRAPAVLIIADKVDFDLAQGQNHINSKQSITVSIVAEEKDSEKLTYLCYRYQDALHFVLDRTQIVSLDKRIKLFVKVTRMEFSSTFTHQDEYTKGFRKEVALTLEVHHVETEI